MKGRDIFCGRSTPPPPSVLRPSPRLSTAENRTKKQKASHCRIWRVLPPWITTPCELIPSVAHSKALAVCAVAIAAASDRIADKMN